MLSLGLQILIVTLALSLLMLAVFMVSDKCSEKKGGNYGDVIDKIRVRHESARREAGYKDDNKQD